MYSSGRTSPVATQQELQGLHYAFKAVSTLTVYFHERSTCMNKIIGVFYVKLDRKRERERGEKERKEKKEKDR